MALKRRLGARVETPEGGVRELTSHVSTRDMRFRRWIRDVSGAAPNTTDLVTARQLLQSGSARPNAAR